MSILNTFILTTALAIPSLVSAASNSDLDVYATAGKMVDIGNHRRLNVRCSGQGSPTVILESGAVADSMDWHKVQPEIAKFARVCSYDRAGYGFSDGGAVKDYIGGSADDLHALIQAAHLSTPVVLVGHSLGSDIVRNYSGRYTADVAAIVLVDPPPQDLHGVTEVQMKENAEQNAAMMAMIGACKKDAAKLATDSPPPELRNCLRPPDPEYSKKLNDARRATKTKSAFWDSTGAALSAGKALDFQPVPASENHGDIPMLILQPDAPFGDVDPADRSMLAEARKRTHEAIAATSTRSKIIPVAHSTHDVQFDQPAAVVEATRTAISQSKSR